MTAADKRRRAEAHYEKYDRPAGNAREQAISAMLAYGAELEAAAIERCEKVCQEQARYVSEAGTVEAEMIKQWLLGTADVIAKLKEQK